MKRSLACASALTMVITMSIAAPSSSQAAPLRTTTSALIQPYNSQGCSVNTCLYLSTPSGGTLLVEGWAYSTNFYGYFVLTAPSGTHNSPTQTWLGGKGNWASWPGIPAKTGQYCLTGYSSHSCQSILQSACTTLGVSAAGLA